MPQNYFIYPVFFSGGSSFIEYKFDGFSMAITANWKPINWKKMDQTKCLTGLVKNVLLANKIRTQLDLFLDSVIEYHKKSDLSHLTK